MKKKEKEETTAQAKVEDLEEQEHPMDDLMNKTFSSHQESESHDF